MQTDAYLRCKPVRLAMFGERALNVHGALQGVLNAAKRDEEAVARVVNLFPAVTSKQRAERLIMPSQHILQPSPSARQASPSSILAFAAS
mgnify:CR=1 FL=1